MNRYHPTTPAICRAALALVDELAESKRISRFEAEGLRAGIWPIVASLDDPEAAGKPLFELIAEMPLQAPHAAAVLAALSTVPWRMTANADGSVTIALDPTPVPA